ncbi:MAG: metallophosphoesterase, partial [Clostridia bacterium]|nr:metallophosphoesterase [Clostridia bacterium]
CDVRGDGWVHVALTFDEELGEIRVYRNGEAVASKDSLLPIHPDVLNNPFCIGGDIRDGNPQFLKGMIRSVAVFDEVRTPEQIKADYAASEPQSELLLASYDFSAGDLTDRSGNGCDLRIRSKWFTEKDALKDYAYSFAVVGDTQIVNYFYPEELSKIYDWIVDNVEEKNIQYVFGLGDITDKDLTAEWNRANENFAKLDGLVPYSVIRGNHDSIEKFDANVATNATYTSQFDGFYGTDSALNSWRTLTVGQTEYLMITLDYGASDEVLAWAGDIIASHPDHKVIITTHAYLYRDGTTLDQGDVCPPATSGGYNNGDHMWEKLISKYENISLVMSGHDPCDNVVVTQSIGEHGNVVTQMLVDPQGIDKREGATGMVTMLYFSEDGSEVQVETYSTVREKYYLEENQFSFEMDADGDNALLDRSMLDVKFQLTKGTTAESEKTDLRMVSTVNSLKYEKVGFLFTINGGNEINKEDRNVYQTLMGTEGETVLTYTPELFHADSEYFFTYTEGKIAMADYDSVLTVRAYVQLENGTVIYGEATSGTIRSLFE